MSFRYDRCYDDPEFLRIVDNFLREDEMLSDTDMLELMIETWLQKLEDVIWRLSRIFDNELD